MRSPTRFSLSCCALLAVASGIDAQKDPYAGFGAMRVGPLDLETPTQNDGHLGVVELNGQLYVSARGIDQQPPHLVYVFNQQGVLLRQFQQQPETGFSLWGYRDGDTDGTNLAFGFEDGIHVINPSNGGLESTFNGRPISNPIRAPGLPVHRGVAFDPNGNGGNGSFWTGDFTSNLIEISLQGNVLRSWAPPPVGPAWSIYGLAWDTQGTPSGGDDTLWVSTAPVNAELREINPRTGQYTGSVIARAEATSVQGGLDGFTGPFGSFMLVALDQGTRDAVTFYRVDNDSQNPGQNEAVMLSRVGTGALNPTSPKYFFRTPQAAAFSFDLSRDPGLLGRPALLLVNAGVGLPSVQFPGFPELVAQLAPALLLGLPGLAPTPIGFSIPPSLALGSEVRMQTAYFEPRIRANALVMTNQVFWERARVVAMAAGPDSYSAVSSRGFFSITNLADTPITEVTLDWTTSSIPAARTREFDTNQTGMADRFDAGNSTVAGCRGTYRNGSHVVVGLVFDGQNTVLGTPCSAASNCGWIGTNPGLDPGDFQTLRFRFTNFRASTMFEFDCDTDGGSGPSGGDQMAGLVVTIKLQTGATLGPTELRALPGQNRAVATF